MSVRREINKGEKLRYIRNNYGVYLMLLPAILSVFAFSYLPMPGILVAFKNYNIFKGIWSSPWSGLDNIRRIFEYPDVMQAVLNTLYLSLLTLSVCFPAPILFALLLNEIRGSLYKRIVQTISYMPYFLSWIAVVAIAVNLYSLYGPINGLLVALKGPETQRILFLANQSFFIPSVLILSVWKGVGFDSIVYLAALSSIDAQLYEAAVLDGAGRLRQTWHITLPGLMPTAMILLILNLGGLFNSNFELVYGLQNPFIDFEVISTFVYKMGIQQANYSMATAVGFMQGLVALVLTVLANKAVKVTSGNGIY